MADKYVIYKDTKGEFRWYYEADNGNKISNSGEGYVNKTACQRGIDIMKTSKDVRVEDTTITSNAFGRF